MDVPPTDDGLGSGSDPLDGFRYQLPAELIAQEPLAQRDASRLLVLERASGRMCHQRFTDLGLHLRRGDLLVLNESRVLPARLAARRATGGRVELLLLHPLGSADGVWTALARPAGRLRPGEALEVSGGVAAVVEGRGEGGQVRVSFRGPGIGPGGVREVLRRFGQVPLPPYIHRPLEDAERYQTVYGLTEGSAAAPTAGLHFTPELLGRLEAAGVESTRLTLHVGLGTFLPLRDEDLAAGRLHEEWFRLDEGVSAAVDRTRARGGRVVAVGTTCVRVLESRATGDGRVTPGEGWTDLFIRPGFRFRCVDALVTNFHLPGSTLVMLVSAFAGRDRILSAYREAVRLRYRFFSFGDAMLIT